MNNSFKEHVFYKLSNVRSSYYLESLNKVCLNLLKTTLVLSI